MLLERAETWARTEGLRRELGASAMKLLKGMNLGGFMQFAVNAFIGYLDEDKLGTMIQGFILTKVAELKVPYTQQRVALMNGLRSGLSQLVERLTETGQLDAIRDGMLESLQLDEKIAGIIDTWREKGLSLFIPSPFRIPSGLLSSASLIDWKTTKTSSRRQSIG